MTTSYLYDEGAGFGHWGEPLSNGYCNLLEWPKDAVKIVELLLELFSLAAKNQWVAKNSTLAISDNNTTAFAGPSVVLPGPVDGQEAESQASGLAEQFSDDHDAAQLATRYALNLERLGILALLYKEQIDADNQSHSTKEIDPTFNPFEPVKNGPSPVIAASEEELIGLICAWIDKVKGTIPDGLRKIDITLLEQSLAHPSVIIHNQETMQATRTQINEKLMAWILKRADGSCMLVKNSRGGNGRWLNYFRWLGGDLGFSAQVAARKVLQNPVNTRSLSPKFSSNSRRSARLPEIKTQRYGRKRKRERRVVRVSPSEAWSPKLNRAKPTIAQTTSKRPRPASDLRRRTPEVSVAARLPPVPEPPRQPPKAFVNKDVVFHFFLADEQHGAIPQPLENCPTMTSFFDEALAAWGALSEEHYQPRMAAVKVIIEGISLPIVVLWRNKEGFERMIATVLEQAALKPTKLSVEVRCFKKG
ncbi:hypothetical protein MMC07_004579 [Pseudocyphellaria aurata]|nr:hypothetical protein [Pseudocyphellaria aurata]